MVWVRLVTLGHRRVGLYTALPAAIDGKVTLAWVLYTVLGVLIGSVMLGWRC